MLRVQPAPLTASFVLVFILMVAIGAAAGFIGWRLERARKPSPTVIAGAPPGQLDRTEFRAPNAPILIAVFTSATCSSCEAVWAELSGYESTHVVTENIEVEAQADMHRRYKIESVPTAVIVDQSGETQAAFVGPLGPDHRETLRTIIAEHA